MPESKVVGRAMSVLWPISRIQALEIPAAFADVPPADQAPEGSTP